MDVTVIYGANHKGSTYEIARLLLNSLEPETVHEFFLPRDFKDFCTGCTNCFMKSEDFCPHRDKLAPIITAMEHSDVLIFTSPVYVLHSTGQMKTFLDHFGYRFMIHRPSPSMFRKKAVIITTAAGGGMKSAIKDIKDSLTYWGVSRIYTYGKAVAAVNWNGVTAKNKLRIEKLIKKTAQRLKISSTKKPSLKVFLLFHTMRFVHKHFTISKVDSPYWKSQGWLSATRPWRD